MNLFLEIIDIKRLYCEDEDWQIKITTSKKAEEELDCTITVLKMGKVGKIGYSMRVERAQNQFREEDWKNIVKEPEFQFRLDTYLNKFVPYYCPPNGIWNKFSFEFRNKCIYS